MLPDFLFAAMEAESNEKMWQQWLAFAPFAALAGNNVTYQQFKAQKRGRREVSDEEIEKIRLKAESWGRR